MGNTHVPLMSSLLVGRGGAALATVSTMLDEDAAAVRCLVVRGVGVGGTFAFFASLINTIVTGSRDAVR